MSKSTIFVVDDDSTFRASLRWLLEAEGMSVETFESGEEFLERLGEDLEGCILLDVKMSGMSGIDVQAALKRRGVNVPVIIITGHGDVPLAVKAMKAGAVEFIEKPFESKALIHAIRSALEQQDGMRVRVAEQTDAKRRIGLLTERELEVLVLLVNGLLNKQVAAELGISPRTVETHRANIMRKTKTENLPALVRLALLAGL
jgi:two-component system response regulator FixJ